MFTIGNDELKEKQDLGETIICPRCGEIHEVEFGEEVLKDGTRVPSDSLAFYKCGKKCYLCGVDGKSII